MVNLKCWQYISQILKNVADMSATCRTVRTSMFWCCICGQALFFFLFMLFSDGVLRMVSKNNTEMEIRLFPLKLGQVNVACRTVRTRQCSTTEMVRNQVVLVRRLKIALEMIEGNVGLHSNCIQGYNKLF